MTRLLGQLVREALATLYPLRCALCRTDELTVGMQVALCAACRRTLTAPESFCRRCGRFLKLPAASSAGCLYCHNLPLAFSAVVPLGRYGDELRTAVLRLKRPGAEPLSVSLADLLWFERREEILALEPDFVAPVPMHWGRRFLRGTNSAERLAQRLARRAGWPLIRAAVVRRRATRPQAALLPRQRLRNVRGAFGLSPGLELRGARVLLVDDILTTGATAGELARMLLRNGAGSVAVAVIARAEPGL